MSENSDIKTIECYGWDEFNEKMREAPGGKNILFRGQADPAWKIQSLLSRKVPPQKARSKATMKFANTTLEALKNDYNKTLEKFKICVKSNLSIDSSSYTVDDWLTLGRHNNLMTPLIDWSLNPYVSFFFALFDCFDKQQENLKTGPSLSSASAEKTSCMALWQLEIKPEDEEGKNGTNENQESIYYLLDHLHIQNERQKRQQGTFTYFLSQEFDCLEEYLKSRNLLERLTKYIVHFDFKKDTDYVNNYPDQSQDGGAISPHRMLNALRLLKRMGINYSKLFPDLEGCAREANARYTL